MIYLCVRQRVGEYSRWREAFDIHLAARQAGGATDDALVLRSVEDRHEIVVLLGWRDLAQARMFIRSVSWQMALQQMGVLEVPEVCFWEGVG